MKLTSFALAVFLAHACSNEQPPESNVPTQKEVNRSMESINRQMAMEESAQIDGYIDRRGWAMTQTGTGLRYMIYESGSGPQAANGMMAKVNYEVSLLDGKVIYSSNDQGAKSFMIGQDHVESGLHEGILFMRVGDKARFVLPSHLAHGLSGDNDKIPPRSSVVFDIELLDLQ